MTRRPHGIGGGEENARSREQHKQRPKAGRAGRGHGAGKGRRGWCAGSTRGPSGGRRRDRSHEVGRGRGADPIWTAADRWTAQFSFDSLFRPTSLQTHGPNRPPRLLQLHSRTKERKATFTTGEGKGASGWDGWGWGLGPQRGVCKAWASRDSSNLLCGF